MKRTLINFKRVKIIILIVVFSTLGLYAQNESAHPELPMFGKELSDLIPSGWKVLSYTSGDLNDDGYEDMAFAIQNTLKENFEHNDGPGIDTLDLNPRILSIYFGKRNRKFKKVLQSNEFILLRDVPTMDEPFDGLTILPNGELQIDFHFWYSWGSWNMSNHQYRFRFQNKAFELIGYEASNRHRGTGDETDYSIDFQNRRMKITTTTINEDTNEQDSEKQCTKFELQKLKTIKSLGKPFEWEFAQIRI